MARGPRVARAPTPLPIHSGKRCFSAERANASKKRPRRAHPPFVKGLKQAVGSLITLTYRDRVFFFLRRRFSGTNPADRRLMQIWLSLASDRAT